VTLRVGPVENLVPTRELRVIGVGETLGDDALQVGLDHRPVQRPPFPDDAVGERDPALGAFADRRKIIVPTAELATNS
jgi:hypothetical protein